jgi:hypothetical protein
MTQANANPSPAAKPKGASPRSNIYTVLIAVAVVALLVGVIFLYRANTKMTGESNPFFIKSTNK